jgi:hypothetical protein
MLTMALIDVNSNLKVSHGDAALTQLSASHDGVSSSCNGENYEAPAASCPRQLGCGLDQAYPPSPVPIPSAFVCGF